MIDTSAIHAAAPTPLEVAERLGLRVARGSRADRAVVACPWHAPDRRPSCVIALRDGRVVAYCHACHQGGDLIDLVGIVRGIDPRADWRRAAEAAASLVGIAIDRRSPAAPRPPTPEAVRLAHAIDTWADDWCRAREPRALPDASAAELIEAVAVLAVADAEATS